MQPISEYATTAVDQLKNYNELGYSFVQSCDDGCALIALRTMDVGAPPCKCDAEKTADSVTTVIYKGLKTYYDNLAKLSDKDLGKYKVTALNKSLTTGSFGSITIGADEASAFTLLGKVIADVATGAYKGKKVKGYIERANAPVQVLLKAMAFNLRDNLGGKLRVQELQLQNIYFDPSRQTSASLYDRMKATEDYRAALLRVKNKEDQLDAFANGLDKLATSHQKLYEQKEKLTVKACQQMMAEYSSEIGDMIDAFKKVKNNN